MKALLVPCVMTGTTARLFLAEDSHNTRWALVHGPGSANYCCECASLGLPGEASRQGRIRLRTTSMSPPQHAHCHCARGVASASGGLAGAVLGRLNTNSLSNAINRLLLEC